MSVSFCASTHAGVRRPTNEDGYCARPDLGLFAVADGVGGYAGGEVASRAAVAALEQAVAETVGQGADAAWPIPFDPALGVDGTRLAWGFTLAERRIRAEAESARGPARGRMATTLAVVLVEPAPDGVACGATLAHVGDSRIYLLRGRVLDRLTRDHSWVEEQVRAGRMSQGDARSHPRRHLLTQALGGTADAVPEFAWVPLTPGDLLLLCTDGLPTVLGDAQIAEILAAHRDSRGTGGLAGIGRPEGRPPLLSGECRPEGRPPLLSPGGGAREAAPAPGTTVCDALVHAANLAGGPDNVTALVISVGAGG